MTSLRQMPSSDESARKGAARRRDTRTPPAKAPSRRMHLLIPLEQNESGSIYSGIRRGRHTRPLLTRAVADQGQSESLTHPACANVVRCVLFCVLLGELLRF